MAMDMAEYHMCDGVARYVSVHLPAIGSRQKHYPKFCVSLYFGTPRLWGEKNPGADQFPEMFVFRY
jgi:hypothetical protein